jgi:hypothetical protein
VINSLQGVTNTYLSAEQSASVFTEELRKQEAQAQKTARANQEAINKQLGVTNTYLSAEQSASVFTEELRKQEAQILKTARANQEAKDKIAKAEAAVTAKLQQESDRREKLRVKETTRAEKEAQKLVDANDKIIASEIKRRAEEDKKAATYAQNFQAQIGPNLGLGAQGISAGDSASAFGAGIEELRLKYDQIYASSQLYERSLAELNTAHLLGILSENKHKASVESLNQEYQNFQNGIRQVGNRFVQHSNQTSDGMNRMGVAAQQTGYQVSDFIVQVQGGTNPLVAFSQQMTQMAGLLYLLPPALQATTIPLLGFKIALSTAFAGVTILIPLLTALAMAFFNSGEEAKAAADGPIKDAEDRIRSLDSALKDYLLTKKAASLGVTKDELISSTGLDEAIAALDAADKKLKQAQENASRRSATGFAPGVSTGAALYNLLTLSNAEGDLLAAQEARTKAAETLRLVEERMAVVYQKQHDILSDTFDLEEARIKLGEGSFAFKKLEAEADRKNYEERLRSSGDLNDAEIADLVLIYQSQQDMLALRKSEVVVAENQRNADRARAQERLAAEQTYQAAIDKTVAKSQYWTDQAKAAERQAVAVDYIVKNLQLLGAKKDAEGFNKAMEDALAAGVKFSLVDLSSIVALAARNGWDLAGALQAAYAAATQKAPAAASVLMGGGGRPEVNLNDMQYRGAVIKGRVAINQKAAADAAAAGTQGGTGPTEATQTAIEKLQEQLAVERELIGTSEAYQKVRQALGEEFSTTSPQVIAGLVAQATQVERLIDLEEQRMKTMDTVKSAMSDTLMSIADGTIKTTSQVRDAFKAMASDIIKDLYRVYVVEQLVNSITGFFAPPKAPVGSVPRLSQAQPRAAGGSMMANTAYMVGEKGPELVIPRHSGTVVNAKQTANAIGGGGSITVQNNITVTGSDAAMVRTEVAKMIPQITNATKAAVLDAKQRGGQFAAAFR